MHNLDCLEIKLDELADPEIAGHSSRFFKTGKGQYGEDDQFLGIRVPRLRTLVKQYPDLSMRGILELLSSPFHEKRLLATLILVHRFQRAGKEDQETIYALYLDHLGTGINNWDIIDTTCPHIMGAWLHDQDRSILYTLAVSKNLWHRRAAMLACFYFIRRDDFVDALQIAEILQTDKEDLLHKATGWMLREIGNRDQEVEERFLEQHCRTMPRTMLQYTIERFDKEQRKYYMERGRTMRKEK